MNYEKKPGLKLVQLILRHTPDKHNFTFDIHPNHVWKDRNFYNGYKRWGTVVKEDTTYYLYYWWDQKEFFEALDTRYLAYCADCHYNHEYTTVNTRSDRE